MAASCEAWKVSCRVEHATYKDVSSSQFTTAIGNILSSGVATNPQAL